MNLDDAYTPEFESLKDLLTDMAQERSVPVLLDLIVTRMILRPHVALVRIWLTREGDQCPRCDMAGICRDKTRCLHLTASAGKSLARPPMDWSDPDGHGKRVPLGHTCPGKVALKGKSLTPEEIKGDKDWQDRESWAPGEGLLGFGAQPLTYKDEIFGVVAVYSRIRAGRILEGRFWLKMIASHTGLAIANARAFDQIQHLKNQLELENEYLKEENASAFGSIVGKSPALNNVLNQIDLVAPTDASVLILGESGTGKELVAREIHKRSLRRGRPMIKVNCAAVPEALYESEFFGHVKGAFTGAFQDRAGRFQAADRGTLFLDEICELPLTLQGKLLRVLQEGTYERVGEEKTRTADVRLITATNRDIRKEVSEGRFRQDLYYRLNVFPVEIAPLRHRTEDIPVLARHFIDKISARMNRPALQVRSFKLDRLLSYDWPGNVRELKNVIERSIIISSGPDLHIDFPDSCDPVLPAGKELTAASNQAGVYTDREMTALMKQNILNALIQSRGRISGPGGAAERLGCAPTTLGSRIKKYRIDRHAVKKQNS